MQFAVLSLFPDMFTSPFAQSIIGKAVEKGLVGIETHQLRNYAAGRHQVTDDTPYGGGDGMVMKPEPVWHGIEDMRQRYSGAHVLLMTPQGQRFNQAEAERLAQNRALVFVCGRYEGFDERIRSYVDAEYSIGDYVLTGGELPAMVIMDAVARLVPGVLGNEGSARQDSHSDGLLEFPHYTRPAEFRNEKVPDILLSGNHARIEEWRRKEQLKRTEERRPDLWQRYTQHKSDN
ncbi:MAG: tRNA (guanosine(37)-N1)-methyltransferase TrmD [Geobacteraceae bacterium]|nr:tRNA (guanosine(37)-N1)-methyltransferase TrmD [Geobacteraceae bacterium]